MIAERDRRSRKPSSTASFGTPRKRERALRGG